MKAGYEFSKPPVVVLVGHTLPFTGKEFSAVGGFLTLGRENDCQIQLEHEKISRKHARLTYIQDHWEIEDLISSNGTFVNGMVITAAYVLHDGDLIGVGGFDFTFHSGERAVQLNDATLLDAALRQELSKDHPPLPELPTEEPSPPPPVLLTPASSSTPAFNPPPPAAQPPQGERRFPGNASSGRNRTCLWIALAVVLVLGCLLALVFWVVVPLLNQFQAGRFSSFFLVPFPQPHLSLLRIDVCTGVTTSGEMKNGN